MSALGQLPAMLQMGMIVQIPIGFPDDPAKIKEQVEGIKALVQEGIRVESCGNPDCAGCALWIGIPNSPGWPAWEEAKRDGQLPQPESER